MSLPADNFDDSAFATPEGEAARWLIRRKEGIVQREEEEFALWLEADPAHRSAYEEQSRAWEMAGEAVTHPELIAMRSEALMIRPPRARRLPAIAAGLATLLALAGGVGFVLLDNQPTRAPIQIAAAPASALRILATGIGERTTVTLEDGSVVTLNTNSRLRIAYSAARRDVVLLDGQVLFQVAKNKDRPFVVTAGDRQVTAVGTEFEVKLEKRGVRVALIEGIVDVRRIRLPGSSSPAGSIEAVTRLEAGEELLAVATGPMTVKAADVAERTSWREGRIRFDDTPLGEAVAEMNRYSKTPIIITDPQLAGIRISGAFKTGQTGTFVSAVTDLFPVEADETEDSIRLRGRQK